MRASSWVLLIIVFVHVSLSTCASIPNIATKLKEELMNEWHEQHTVSPLFSLKQLQHAATMMHSLWHNGENVYNSEQPIERQARATHKRDMDWQEVAESSNTEHTIRKREEGIPADHQLCAMGTPIYNVTMQNSCVGAICTVQEALCTNGTVVTTIYPNTTNIRTFPWSQCEVTKMLCYVNGRTESINMKEQYGVTNCSLITDRIVCRDMQPYGLTCIVQVTCSNYTNWGEYAWGLQCSTDRLSCNGVIVRESSFNNYQRRIINGECAIDTVACAERSVARNCSKLNLTCGYQKQLGHYSGCSLERMDVSCPLANSTSSNCTIAQIICNGTIIDASVPYVNQSQCSIYSLTCNGNKTIIQQSSCTPALMVCSGTSITFAAYNGSLALCSLSQVRCGLPDNCTALELACPEAPKCTLTQLPCSVACQRELNTSSCICPDDYTGRFCETQAQYSCSASLIYPPVKCLPAPTADPKDYLLSGDRKCTVFDDYEGNATLAYSLDCAFANPSTIQYSSANFTYWIKNEKLSISKEVNWALRYKIFNFNQLFDGGGSLYTGNLTAPQILGDELVWFNFSLQKVPERFWYARRLYYELRFNPGPSGQNTTFWRNFIDAPTRPISTKTMSTVTTFTLVVILGSIAVFLGLVGYVTYKCYRAHRRDPKQKY